MTMLPGALRTEDAKERWDDDWYVEPPEAVAALFDNVRFVGWVHDPACGAGNIPKIARQYGYNASGCDLVDRGFPCASVFLSLIKGACGPSSPSEISRDRGSTSDDHFCNRYYFIRQAM